MDCQEVREKVSEFVDNDLVDEVCLEITRHLAGCQDCTVDVDTVRKTITLYKMVGAVQVPVRVIARLEQAMVREYGRAQQEPRAD